MRKNLNHAKVNYYRVTQNPNYDFFAISPDYLFEDKLRFVYMLNGIKHEKIVPLTHIGRYLSKKPKKLIWYDYFLEEKVYRGEFYTLPVNVIYNY